MKPILIMLAYIRYHSSPIPFPLKERMNRQILQLQYTTPLIRNHSYGYGCCCPILHYEHFAPFQVFVNHGFLFISKEQKRQITFLIVYNRQNLNLIHFPFLLCHPHKMLCSNITQRRSLAFFRMMETETTFLHHPARLRISVIVSAPDGGHA